MTPLKLLLWMEYDFLMFGVANHLQEKYDFDISAIIDCNETLKKFFLEQNIVSFNNKWFLNDHIKIQKPNLKYLKSIEEKYQINLWDVAYTERLFYPKYNKFYKFSYDEILSIIEETSRLYEKILEEVAPEFVLMTPITRQHEYLLYLICKAMNIRVLVLDTVRFADRWYISKGLYNSDENEEIPKSNSIRNPEEILQFLKSHKPARFYLDETYKKYKISKSDKIKAILEFFIKKRSSNYQYSYYGRNKLNILTRGSARLHLIKTWRRQSYLDKNSIKVLDDIPFVYFPLHEEPEKVLLMGAKYYSNQFSVIENIAKSIPVEYKLYVKDHPVMKIIGWRDKSFYKQIRELPNVELVHPLVKQDELIKKCSLLITIRGTAAIESVFYQKPAIVLCADYGWSSIPSIHVLKNISDLSVVIRQALSTKPDLSQLSDFMDYIKKNSFEFPLEQYSANVANSFKYNVGYSKQEDIDESKMTAFLDKNKGLFERLSDEYLKKIRSEK